MKDKFEHLLKDNFGITKKIVFCNNKALYEKTSKEIRDGEAKDIKDSLKKYSEGIEGKAATASGLGPGTKQGAYDGAEKKGQEFGDKQAGPRKRREKELPAEGNRIMGSAIGNEPIIPLTDIDPKQGTVVVEGILFKKDFRIIRSGNYLITLLITDNKPTTNGCKGFVSENKWNEIDTLLQAGDGVKIRGEVQFDTYENMDTIMIKAIEKKEKLEDRMDNCQIGKRVELHAHTKMSAMDGLNEVSDLVKQAAMWGQPAVAITDHGVVQAFPDAAKEAKKQAEKGRPIKIINGMEGYVFDDSDCIREDGTLDYKKKPTNHIILLAKNQEGLKNIYKLVSLSHLNYFYKKPRLPWSVLEAHREGLLIGSACEAGEVYRAVLDERPEDEIHRIAARYDYLEIQPLINNRFLLEQGRLESIEALQLINRKIVSLADEMGKPIVATTDSHYKDPASAIYRNILMAGQGYKDAENGQGLYLRTTDEKIEL